jgi:cell division transport system permease protein
VATLAIVIYATQAGLQAHREIVEVVHMIGARDVFIASEFQRHFLWLGLRGGLIGLVLAAATLLSSSFFWDSREAPVGAQYLPQLVSAPHHYIWLLFVPAAIGLIAMWTARFTVLRVLGRMP